MASCFADYGKYEQSIETSTDPKDHDGVWKTGLIEILYENCTVNSLLDGHFWEHRYV